MKKTLLFLAFLLGIALQSWAQSQFSYTYEGQTLYYKIVDGNAHLYYQSAHQNLSGALIIPSTVTYSGTTYNVTAIDENTFSRASRLTSVVIPNSVTYIDKKAFYQCYGLTSVTIGNSVTFIGEYAFNSSDVLTAVYYTGDVADWCRIKFVNTYSNPLTDAHNLYLNDTLVTHLVIPNTVDTIGDYAFKNCTCLTGNLTIPNSVIAIGGGAFGGCTGLTGNLTIPNSVTYIGSSAFSGCSGLTGNLDLPNVTSIGSSAFFGCSGLNGNLNIPNATSIGSYAFYGCSGLNGNLSITNATTIGTWAFYECSGLNGDLNIPNVISIGNGAFYECSGLTGDINLPNDTTIGFQAFYGCSGLNGNLNIPSIKTIGASAFYGCSGLTGNITLSDSLTTIGDTAFQGCSGLTGTLTLPNTVTSIGKGAFRDCASLTTINYNAANCTMTTGINYYVFSGCTSVTTVNIGEDVQRIGSTAFYGCSGLTTVNYNATNCTTMGAGSYHVFPTTSSLTTLNIGENVQTIPSSAFINCQHLTTVNFNATNCTAMGTANSHVFYGPTSSATQVTPATLNIGNNVLRIPDYAFYNFKGLTNANIGNSVTSIGISAFEQCTNLTSAPIPNSVITIGISAFRNCSNLTSVTIPNSVTSIRSCTFYDCTSLTSVIIGSSVTTIDSAAFKHCSNIAEIHSLNSVAPTLYDWYELVIYGSSFSGVPSNTPVYIPCGSLQSYQDKWGYWRYSSFTNFIEEISATFSAVSDNETMGTVNIDTYPDCTDSLATVSATANAGYIFSHWSDGSTDNPHTILVASDTTVVAYFVPAATVTVTSDNTTMGAGIGSGIYAIGGTATISAEANYGYHFTQWNDGNTANPRTIDVIGDTSFIAYFEPNQYTVNVVSDNTELGSVTGGGTFDYGTTITISAAAVADYHFTHWQDGNTQNPRTVTVTADTTYTAYFAIDEYTLTVMTNYTSRGTVTGGGTYAVGTTVTISAEANNGYHFTQWQDGNTDNPRTVTVTGNATYTANFEANDYIITVLSDNPTMGTVTGGGTYAYSSTISISAQPAEGCWFAYWQDGNNDNPRYITVTGNAEYVAHFYRPEGIDDVTTADGMKIYTRGNNIVIETNTEAIKHSGNQAITVYDVMGRVIKQTAGSGQQAAVEIPVTSAGVYMVKVGERPSRKVVVRP